MQGPLYKLVHMRTFPLSLTTSLFAVTYNLPICTCSWESTIAMRLTIVSKVSSKNCLDGSDTLLLLAETFYVVSTVYSKMKWGLLGWSKHVGFIRFPMFSGW